MLPLFKEALLWKYARPMLSLPASGNKSSSTLLCLHRACFSFAFTKM
jgi:hypothetical protein